MKGTGVDLLHHVLGEFTGVDLASVSELVGNQGCLTDLVQLFGGRMEELRIGHLLTDVVGITNPSICQ